MDFKSTIRSAREVVAIAEKYGYILSYYQLSRSGVAYYRIVAKKGIVVSPYPIIIYSRPVKLCTILRYINDGIL